MVHADRRLYSVKGLGGNGGEKGNPVPWSHHPRDIIVMNRIHFLYKNTVWEHTRKVR